MDKILSKIKELKGRKLKIAVFALVAILAIGAFGVFAIEGPGNGEDSKQATNSQDVEDGEDDGESSDSDSKDGENDKDGEDDKDGEESSSKEGSSSSEGNSSSSSSSGSSGANEAATPAPSNDITVYISASCRSIIDNKSTIDNAALVQAAGSGYLVGTYVTVPKGSTALQASQAAGDFRADGTGYVYRIGGVAAGEAGVLSGWMYTVNGSRPSTSASKYTLNDGDSVKWGYTLDGSSAY